MMNENTASGAELYRNIAQFQNSTVAVKYEPAVKNGSKSTTSNSFESLHTELTSITGPSRT